MFKNLKLSMKMAGGFGVLVVIAAVLGLTGWWGLSGVSQNVGFYDQGNVCLEKINKCGYLRRDFTIRGFEKFGGEGKDASEQWLSVYDELAKDLQLLTVEEGLSTEGRELAKAGLASGEQYKQAFGLQISSRKAKDDAFAEWGKVGWDVTKIIEETTQQVIAPKRDAAEQSKDAEAIIQWSKIASGLDEQFIQPFLLLRVCAVYLLATDADKKLPVSLRRLSVDGGLVTFADQAALAAADAADIAAYYTGDTIAPGLVLLSEETADAAVAEFVAANSCLITDFADFYVDDVTTDGRTVTVTFGARAYLPILTPFLEIWSDGIGLVVTSSARAW